MSSTVANRSISVKSNILLKLDLSSTDNLFGKVPSGNPGKRN
jgi:hypothetical protein